MSKRIGIFSTHQRQQPFAVFGEDRVWRIWISYNPTVTGGTYLELSNTGAVDRVTINNETVTEVVKIC